MGHGTHWEAVLANVSENLASVIPLAIRDGNVIGRCRKPAWNGPMGSNNVECTLIQSAPSGFGCATLVVSDKPPRNYLHTAFPVAAKGPEHAIRVLSVQEASYGLEACITAMLGEAQITFFEPYYALNSDRYKPGAELGVALAGIVYHLEIADPNESVINPELGEVHLRGAAVLLSAVRADHGMCAANGFGISYLVAPSEGPGADDYSFRGPVKYLERIEFLTRPAWRITATLLRINDGATDVDVDLYVVDERIRHGDLPAVGADITGDLWLQGFVSIPEYR